ncbi:hypothetical protein BJ508DRAFT_7493 [Ascobolus immersus RN42]|uniref:Uncharacterized protein n=1 Tax=Ascobolus immersus RN42 TaxID=1160509 RepID=A0A3N4IHP0_ASCIM|nr:hypothetical protein BJ508DRAFT_7493 [Ascobolus immersus RN42]
MALVPQYPPHHMAPQWVHLNERPLREQRLGITIDCARAFIKSIGGLTKLRRIREAEDVAEQVSGIKSALEDLAMMNDDGFLDALYVDNNLFEDIISDISNTHQLLEDCDRLLARMKKNGIKWDIKHDVLVASILAVWRDFAFEMGDRLHQALVSKLKRRKERLQGYIITLRKLKRRQQEAMEQKVQMLEAQHMDDMWEMQERLRYLEEETRKAAQAAQSTRKLLEASPAGPPRIVDAQPSPTLEAQHAVAIYEPVPVLDPYSPPMHGHYPPSRPPTAPAPPIAPIPPPPPQPQAPRYIYDGHPQYSPYPSPHPYHH